MEYRITVTALAVVEKVVYVDAEDFLKAKVTALNEIYYDDASLKYVEVQPGSATITEWASWEPLNRHWKPINKMGCEG